jgi:hypothetical protein
MNDFQLLGMAETRDPRLVKEAFRARAKELHPDIPRDELGADPLKRHLLFIALTGAYRRILSNIEAAPQPPCQADSGAQRPPSARAARGEEAGTALRPHSDPAYAFYKNAMRYYMAIHPSAWEPRPSVPSERYADRGAEEEAMRKKVEELVTLFPKAYYYFSVVVTEYPGSPWAADARDKMALIERRTAGYKRILASFGAWKRAGKERGAEVSGIVDRTRKILEEEGELRWPSP